MSKKAIFFSALILIICASAFAAGGKDNMSRTSGDVSGFTDSVDTSSRRPGRYNYYLEARDRAGNITLSGPDNIDIDPVSDLPQATIISPMPNMRVQGNLNVVGIAVDDDAVAQVLISVRRGTDGKGEQLVYVTAEGADHWSYFLDTTDPDIWTDGVYTITAWAVDINGISGIAEHIRPRQHKTHSVIWHLDRKQPVTTVTSHGVGALVSGNIRLRGHTADGNGIKNLAYSVDGGERYTQTRINYDRRTGLYNWEINLATRSFEDGAQVIWFRAHDGQGSQGIAAHLLFINNTGPQVQIVYPAPDAAVNGLFTISGLAKHDVGLRSVSWKAGNIASGEFELLPGNHWWSTNVDLRGQRVTSIDIEVRAEDVSGNVTTARQRYRVNPNDDLPVVTLQEPAAGVLKSGDNVIVKGSVADDDGVASIFYSINAGPPVEVPCSGYFQFMIPTIPEGTNNLEVWAKDTTGVIGNKVLVRGLVVPGAKAEVSIASFTSGTGRTAVISNFYTGMPVTPVQRMTMQVNFKGNGLIVANVAIGSLPAAQIRVGSPNREGVYSVNIPFPAELPGGLTKIQFTLTDRFGREVTYDEYVLVSGYSDYTFNWVRHKELEDGRIIISSQEEVLIGLGGTPLSYAVLSGAGAANLEVSVDEQGRVKMRGLQEGDSGPLTLQLTAQDGVAFETSLRVITDFYGPTITLTNAGEYIWVQNSVQAAFNLTGRIRLKSAEYSLDMGTTWNDLLTQAEVGALGAVYNSNVAKMLDITDIEDGSLVLLIKATAESGVESIANLTVLKDTVAPQAVLITPNAEARVNGTIRMGFAIEEAGTIQSVRYIRPASPGVREISAEVFNAETWNQNYSLRFLEVLMDSLEMPLDEKMRFVFTDKADNNSEVALWDFVIDKEMDIPTAFIILPTDGSVITSDFLVSGIMFDDDAIKQIYWKIDKGQEQTLVAENSFLIPVSLLSLTDNEHTITVVAEDIYGVRSEEVTCTIKVSLAEPTGAISYPLLDTILRETIEIRGTAVDANGIQKVQVSLDNGNTFNTVHATYQTGNVPTTPTPISWNYYFNTKVLSDGPHAVFFRIIDNYDVFSTYASMINVDNTPPDIAMDNPVDGSISVGTVPVMSRILDPNLKAVSIEVRSLDGVRLPPELMSRGLSPVPIIRETVNLMGYPDGVYDITIMASDNAGNVTRTSRNVQLARETYKNFIEILYPLDNEEVHGEFNLYGFAGGTDPAGTVTLSINDSTTLTSEVDEAGYFRFNLNAENLAVGVNNVVVYSYFGGATATSSEKRSLVFSSDGPWVTIDSFAFGEFAYDRPYIYGRTGYILSAEDRALLADRSTDRMIREEIQAKRPNFTEISFDNGQTFTRTSGSIARNVDYRYRLETGDMTEGMHYIIVRTTMRNEEKVVTRMIVQVDKTPPVIRLISPEVGGRYNTEILYSASASDDIELESFTYHLRAGDKTAYELPGFLQGLYLEAVIPPFIRQIDPVNVPVFFSGGATYMDIGLGLSFFDDNVKIQAQYGFMTNEQWVSLGGTPDSIRYGGQVLGIKLLASVYQLPFGSFAGPDWEWLSATFALGANFSLFDLGSEGYTQSGTPTWMSALLFQVEFPRMTIPKIKAMRTYSIFTEGQLWFVPTDVDASALGIDIVIPHITVGFRMYVF